MVVREGELGSRPSMDRAGGQSRVNYGMKDLFVFIVYVMMAVLIPQLMHAIFGSWAGPLYWHGESPHQSE